MTNDEAIRQAVRDCQGKAACNVGDVVCHPDHKLSMEVLPLPDSAKEPSVLREMVYLDDTQRKMLLPKSELFDFNDVKQRALELLYVTGTLIEF